MSQERGRKVSNGILVALLFLVMAAGGILFGVGLN